MENETPCVLKETYPSKDAVEKSLKRDLKDHRKGDNQAEKLMNLCQHLFNWTWTCAMQFQFPPILLLVYYAVTAVCFALLWASLVILNDEMCIGLSPIFIYEVLMACTPVDLKSVEMLIQLAVKLANMQLSEGGLEVSLDGMLQKLFRISGTNPENAIANGSIPNHFADLGIYFAGQVHRVLCDNPQQMPLIIRYLEGIAAVQNSNDIPSQTYNPQDESHASMPSEVLPLDFQDMSYDELMLELFDTG
ncbi:hypothetical protein Cpir12675_005864 [Ceratocystis pirilliformis]|uniref:Uncharacterized protein n=1 Tax=Ceratocystis pirilliformis TaxID=259994 RepID=A0ABR3YLK9_9PEZI